MQPHHKTQFGISSYLGRNSLDQTSYFSPKESISVGVDFNHDWLTWREYEQSLTQKFSLTTGFYKQNQFDAEPVVDIRYGHQWQLTRTWGLQYGVGWGMHPYDGEKEKNGMASWALRGNSNENNNQAQLNIYCDSTLSFSKFCTRKKSG